MTAQRWWVRLAAWWLAALDGVAGQLRLAFLAMTGVSTALVALRSYGYGQFAWPVILVSAGGALAYTYLYAKGGVWNQQRRDKADMATNWAGPNMLIQARLIGASLKGERLTEEERRAVRAEWQELRNGVDVDD